METPTIDAEFDAALAELTSDAEAWFASCRHAQATKVARRKREAEDRAAKVAQRKRELDSLIQAINAVGRYLDQLAVDSGALGG